MNKLFRATLRVLNNFIKFFIGQEFTFIRIVSNSLKEGLIQRVLKKDQAEWIVRNEVSMLRECLCLVQ